MAALSGIPCGINLPPNVRKSHQNRNVSQETLYQCLRLWARPQGSLLLLFKYRVFSFFITKANIYLNLDHWPMQHIVFFSCFWSHGVFFVSSHPCTACNNSSSAWSRGLRVLIHTHLFISESFTRPSSRSATILLVKDYCSFSAPVSISVASGNNICVPGMLYAGSASEPCHANNVFSATY